MERFRIAAAGQLGIGGANYGTDGQVLTSTGTNSAPAWEDASGGVAGISSSADATAITIDSAEQVGIGQATPAARLDIAGMIAGEQALLITTPRNDALSNGLARINITDANCPFTGLQIDHAGTGIALDVNGKATVSGTLTIDSDIIHTGDTDTKIGFDTNTINFTTGYVTGLSMVSGVNYMAGTPTLPSGSAERSYIYHKNVGNTSLHIGNQYGNDAAFIALETRNTQRMRIEGNGEIVIGNTGTPAQVGKLNTSGGITQAAFYVGNTGFASKAMIIGVEGTGDNSGYNFAEYWSGRRFDNSSGDIEFKFRGDGNAYADASWNASGADYAEYFEWSDGNGSSQDRIGLSVVLDGNKIREATGSDAAGTIIGVISGNAAVVGDTSFDKWTGKYEKDDYGRYVYENYVDENGDTLKRRKPSASYDDSLTYVEREKRKEWDTVGLMGKLRMKKGQQTGTNWIKMRDISASVEEWLVR